MDEASSEGEDPPPAPARRISTGTSHARGRSASRDRRTSTGTVGSVLTTASGLPVPNDVAEIVDRIKANVDVLNGLQVEQIEPYLKKCDELSHYLHAKVGAARRELDKDEDRTKLMIDPDGWQRLGERVGDLARDYLGAGDDLEDRPLKAFQVEAIEALFEGKDVLLALPCGAGKTGPPAIFGAQRAIEAYEEDLRLCFSVWVVPTTLLCLDKVRDLNGRFWRWNEGDDKFAVAVDSRGKKRDALGVVYDEAGDGTRPKRRHPVLQAVEDREICVGALVLTPEMFAVCQAWFCVQARAGHISCFVIDEADDETGVVDSYRGKQSRQGKLVRAVVDYAIHERNNQVCVPVVALSGTVAKGDLNRLKADLRLSEYAFELRAAPQRVHVGVEVQISRRPATDVSLALRLISGTEERVIDAIHPLVSAQVDVVISKAGYAARGVKKAARAWKLSAAAKLLNATEPLDHEHVSRRAERRQGADARLKDAKDLLFRGPHAVVAGEPDPDNIPLDRINDEEEDILTRIDQYVAQRRAVNEKYQSVLNEKSVFVSHQDYRTLVGGRQQLQAIDARAQALAKEKDHLGRKIKYLQRKRAELRRAELDEAAAASSSDEEDESGDKSDAESGDDDDAHVRRDEVLVFSVDSDADHEAPGGDDD